jgi:hypothetical protein
MPDEGRSDEDTGYIFKVELVRSPAELYHRSIAFIRQSMKWEISKLLIH